MYLKGQRTWAKATNDQLIKREKSEDFPIKSVEQDTTGYCGEEDDQQVVDMRNQFQRSSISRSVHPEPSSTPQRPHNYRWDSAFLNIKVSGRETVEMVPLGVLLPEGAELDCLYFRFAHSQLLSQLHMLGLIEEGQVDFKLIHSSHTGRDFNLANSGEYLCALGDFSRQPGAEKHTFEPMNVTFFSALQRVSSTSDTTSTTSTKRRLEFDNEGDDSLESPEKRAKSTPQGTPRGKNLRPKNAHSRPPCTRRAVRKQPSPEVFDISTSEPSSEFSARSTSSELMDYDFSSTSAPGTLATDSDVDSTSECIPIGMRRNLKVIIDETDLEEEAELTKAESVQNNDFAMENVESIAPVTVDSSLDNNDSTIPAPVIASSEKVEPDTLVDPSTMDMGDLPLQNQDVQLNELWTRTYSREDQKSTVLMLPWEYQTSRVKQSYRVIRDMADQKEVEDVCEFPADDVKLDVFKLNKAILEDGKSIGKPSVTGLVEILEKDHKQESDLTIGSEEDPTNRDLIQVKTARSGISRALEHWHMEGFRDCLAFFQLNAEELMLHSRTLFNYPGMARTPYWQQIYITVVLVKMILKYNISILGDRPGLGKTTVKEMAYIALVHLGNLHTEIENDRRRAKLAKKKNRAYTRKHLPANASAEEVCPSAKSTIYQCPCHKNAVFPFDGIQPLAGPRFEIMAKAQIFIPGMEEAWKMQQPSATGWARDYKNEGIGQSGPLIYRVNHTDLVRASGQQLQAMTPDSEDFHLIKPTFAINVENTWTPVNPPPQQVEYDDDRFMDQAPFKRCNWIYEPNPKAHTFTLAGTPHFMSKKALGPLWNAKVFQGKMNPDKKIRGQDQTYSKDITSAQYVAKPGLLDSDEWHNARGDISTAITNLNTDFSKLEKLGKHKRVIANVPITSVILMSGTPLTESAAGDIAKAANLIESQYKAFRDEEDWWENENSPFHFLSQGVLKETARRIRKISGAIHRTFKKKVAEQVGDGTLKLYSQQIPETQQKALIRENTLAEEYLVAILIQRDALSSMFGQPFGLPVIIKKVFIPLKSAVKDKVNSPAFSKGEHINQKIKYNRLLQQSKGKKQGAKEAKQVMTDVIVSDPKVRLASCMPGFHECSEAWSQKERERLDRQLQIDQVDPVVMFPKRLAKKRWSELTDEHDRVSATKVHGLNGEMTVKKMVVQWPHAPHTFFKENYHKLLGVAKNSTRPQELKAGAQEELKAEKFYTWMRKVWFAKDQGTQIPSSGFFASLNTCELETFRAFAFYEFGKRSSPWFIADNIERELFPIYTKNWTEVERIAAVRYVLGGDADEFQTSILESEKLEKHKWLQSREWQLMRRRPRILFGGSVLAEGLSATRFDYMLLTGPFYIRAKILQIASRSQRVTAEYHSDIEMMVAEGCFYDILALGNFEGPQDEQVQEIQESMKVEDDGVDDEDDEEMDLDSKGTESDNETFNEADEEDEDDEETEGARTEYLDSDEEIWSETLSAKREKQRKAMDEDYC